jgi:hypothetical protein
MGCLDEPSDFDTCRRKRAGSAAQKLAAAVAGLPAIRAVGNAARQRIKGGFAAVAGAIRSTLQLTSQLQDQVAKVDLNITSTSRTRRRTTSSPTRICATRSG